MEPDAAVANDRRPRRGAEVGKERKEGNTAMKEVREGHRVHHPMLTLASFPAHWLGAHVHFVLPTAVAKRVRRRHINLSIGVGLTLLGVELSHSAYLFVEVSGWVLHGAGWSPIAKAVTEMPSVAKVLETMEVEL